MRPTRLEVEGFTSFRQNVALDFSSLDLFVITGPTGAGKTSVIDAIIYALYGRTPRIGDKAGSDLISQGLERMRVLLEFKAGKKDYRLLRTLKRGSSAKLQLEVRNSTGDWDAISNKVFEVRQKVEEILGVDFDGFTKSIVLPQGEFDKFLRGDPVERRRILSDLLHLNIYEEMGKRARQIEQNARIEQSVLEQHLATAYAEVSEERKAELEKEFKRLTAEQQQLSSEIKVVQKIQPWAIELGKERDRRTEASRNLALVVKELTKAETAGRLLQDKVKGYEKRIKDLDSSIKMCGYDEKRHLELSSILPIAKQREELQTAIALSKEELSGLKADLKRLEPSATKAKEKWQALVPKLDASDKLWQARKKEYDEAKKRYGSADVIVQTAQDWMAANEQISERQELEDKIALTQKRIEDAETDANQLQQLYDKAEVALREANADLVELRQRHSVDDIRRRLKKGEPCPVCEQAVSALPKPGKHAAIERAQELVEERQRVRDRHNTALLKKTNLRESLPNELKILRKNLRTVENSISSAVSKAERILGKSPGTAAGKELEQLAQRVSKFEADSASAAEKLQEMQGAESDARDDSKTKENEIKQLSRELATVEAGIADKAVKLKEIEKELRGEGDLKAVAEEVKQLEKAKRQKDGYEAEKKKEEVAYSTAENQRIAVESDVTSQRKRSDELRSSVEALAGSIAKLEARIRKEMSFRAGADELEELNVLRTRLETDFRKSAVAITTIQNRLETIVRGLEEVSQKRTQIKELKSRVDLYHELGVALKADQFIRFIVEQALRRLAEYGTHHLNKLSSGRYSFGSETDDFLVLDHWNADESRSVNTLSGGESFLASLSLALALGDALVELSTNSGALSLESLFLDEGFSTLDLETLDVVVQGIEALAGGERLVGVISHVPELAERFPVQIQVKKAIGGSTVVVVGGIGEIKAEVVATS
jgi:DNA repair protein SbcC/Rad50